MSYSGVSRHPVIIVNASESFRSETRAALAAAGFRVETFPDPIAAVQRIYDPMPLGLVVTGIHYPKHKSNGLALARILKHRRPTIPILFTDSHVEIAEERLGDLLPAPVSVDSVVAAIKARFAERLADPVL